VLEAPAVAAVIVGARLGENQHRDANLAAFGFALTEADRAEIDAALASLAPIQGDCGREYRKPPFLTASGDLSHHLDALPAPYPARQRGDRATTSSGSAWEAAAGFSRAIRVGDRILVSGTTATHGAGRLICPGDARGQTVFALDKIAASLASLGGSLEDVVRTRIYMADCDRWEEAARVHGAYFAEIAPANTLLEISRIVGDYEVEIEAEAVVRRTG
jgi:enamine deaminase RidA (YjgF/YER057c/UK114 family)